MACSLLLMQEALHLVAQSAASRFFSVQNADGCRSLCRYDRHCRYADLCVHRSLSSHAICSSVHTTWKSRPRAGFRCTSRNCCYTWLQRLSRFLKHRPACHRVRQDPLRHGVSFSFSPDASLYRNRKKRHTSSDFHSMDTE